MLQRNKYRAREENKSKPYTVIMVKIKLGSKEIDLSGGAIAGIAIACVAVLIGVSIALWYTLDGKYLNYGSTVTLQISPDDGSGPLYVLMQQTGTMTLVDVKDQATGFRILAGDVSDGALVWNKIGTATNNRFTVFDPLTGNYVSDGEVAGQYTYIKGSKTKTDARLFDIAVPTGSKAVVGSRILPGSTVNVVKRSGGDDGLSAILQYQSQLNNGIAGIISCNNDNNACLNVDWVIG
jgi:hypothetical protein